MGDISKDNFRSLELEMSSGHQEGLPMVMVEPRRTGRAPHSFIYSCSHSLIQETLLMHSLYAKGSAWSHRCKKRGPSILVGVHSGGFGSGGGDQGEGV